MPSPITDASFPLTVTVDGYEVTISDTGDVTVDNDQTQTKTPLKV